MSASLSTHVLDTARGTPAAGIEITLYAIEGDRRTPRGHAVTNPDGRTDGPLANDLRPGTYELIFAVGQYFARAEIPAFYDTIPIRVLIPESGRYHVPLLLSPWGYSTYRGS
jgi:5-hydroxyisourate hydrolase